ncbi:MAG: [ribosomal protein S5]-alanine N-acetyltransferase [Acidobacteriota bacterium]|jgi:RimJ/RimL family protein N-acetyltransferase|nr:[ribosomal protein S5]-alanine N-acetyltransferase [Acidobacteriota bacterium]
MVELHGQQVRLRELRADDLDASLTVVGDDRVTKSLSFNSLDRDTQAVRLAGAVERAQYLPRTEYYLAVTALVDDLLIGFARLELTGMHAAKLGGAGAVGVWGQGYATDAARTLITYGFNDLGLHRITAAIGPDNTASLSLVGRLGFTYEGRLRDHVHTNGAWRDSNLYSMLATEWKSNEGISTERKE